MILIHGANSISRGDQNSVIIGSRSYPYKQFGNLFWITENLKENVGDTLFPNGNAANVERYGLLYKISSTISLPNKTVSSSIQNIIPSGWRIPSKQDCLDLFNSVGGESVAYSELAKEEVGFNLTYPGDYVSWSGYSGFNSSVNIMMTGTIPSYSYETYTLMTYRTFYQSFNGDYYITIRLVKDT